MNTFSRYIFYLSSQKWNREKIECYQDERLKNIISHAARNVPYYRNLFKKIKLNHETFRGRIDMHKIPPLDKETLRKRSDEFIADDAITYGINWDSTSGSTGTPLRLIIDNSTKAHKLAAVIRAYQWAGYFPGKKVFSIQSYTFNNSNKIFKHYRFINLWRFNSRLLRKETALDILKMIDSLKPNIFIGYPFSMLMLKRFADQEGIQIHPFDAIVTAGETLSERRRKLLESAYQCKVIDFYSHHENVAIISECRHQKKHLFENFAYNEIAEQKGNDTSKHVVGELLGTGFYNYAMPLIRYKTGDTVVMNDDNSTCECGMSFKTISQITGRQNDYIETPDGRFLGNVLEHAVDKAKGVMLSQCVQDSIDHIYINIICDNTFDHDSIVAFETGLRERLGNEIKIEFKIVQHLERNQSGKTPFILSKIGHHYL